MRLLPLMTLVALLPSAAFAADETAPTGVLGLSATASVEVTRDLLTVVFTTARDGTDPTSVQNALKQSLDAALAEARRITRAGEVDVRTGDFSLHPRYAPPKGGSAGGIVGWQGSAELVVAGTDIDAIARLTGRIQTMTISRVGYALSRQLREKVEREAAAEAIARFRAKAAEHAQHFGYAGYTIREVTVSPHEPPPMPVTARAAPLGIAEQALPVEPGRGSVNVSVSGTVQMTK